MTKKVIICVDDEITVLRSLKTELKKAIGSEYSIEIAEGGEDALELIEELLDEGYEIPLIISDHIMPHMQGDELLKRVHQISPKTLKVLLTGQASIEAVGNAIQNAKLYRYIAKPWQAEDLRLTVREAINSYFLDKKLTEQNAKLQQLALEQAALIEKLQENENRLQQFLEAMPVGVFVTDAIGQPYYVNSRAKQLLGQGIVANTTSEELREVYQVYRQGSEELYPKDEDILQRALKGESARADDVEIRQGETIIPIEVWGTPIYDAAGKVAYAIAAFNDIAERKKSEAEREKLLAELSQLNGDLETALEAELALTDAAGRFVPNQFLYFLGYESIVNVKLGEAVQKDMSILFADIRDFTSLSECMTPEDNFKFINSYLSHMEPAIIENQGFIDKYMGDAIMALFPGGADEAVKAGISMLQRLVEYNKGRDRSGYVPIKIGLGINTGSLMLGTVGGKSRIDGTAIGDAVNLASRLEGLTKNYGVPLLISHPTFLRLTNSSNYAIRPIGQVRVKGKSEKVTVYEVFDADPPDIKACKLATLKVFEEALSLYNLGAFDEAAQCFEECLRIYPNDKVARIYWERCQQQIGLQTLG